MLHGQYSMTISYVSYVFPKLINYSAKNIFLNIINERGINCFIYLSKYPSRKPQAIATVYLLICDLFMFYYLSSPEHFIGRNKNSHKILLKKR